MVMKRSAINSIKHGTHELPNDLRLRKSGNLRKLGKIKKISTFSRIIN